MTLFTAIKNKSLAQLREAAVAADLNEQDNYGRTPLHYAITQKAPIELFEALLELGADPRIKDKLGESVIGKAIKFKNKAAVQALIARGAGLDHPAGVQCTPWFQARHYPEIADLLLSTKGAVRLTLTQDERNLIDEVLYSDEPVGLMHKLKTPELLHAYVLGFNWDDDIQPMEIVLQHPDCMEITAIEMFELADGEFWLEHEQIQHGYKERFVRFVNHILQRFPNVYQSQ
ncbi:MULTISPECIES: DUF4274 domain-containing protein [Paenibacillus]|nr:MULTISPECIES: DUF4274 domain-containing protein [Paenibacillus]